MQGLRLMSAGDGGGEAASGGDAGRNLVDELADYLLYAPLGVIISIGEDMPNLIEKGRARVESRVTTARVVGQFAVAMGKRKAEDVVRQRFAPPARTRGGTSAGPAEDGAAAMTADESAAHSEGPVTPRAPARRRTPDRGAPAARTTAKGPSGDADDEGGEGSGGADVAVGRGGSHEAHVGGGAAAVPVDSLAIPGYDSLAASQVVQRLEGLLPEELDEVRRYEESTRGRRTILGRINQLGDAPQG
jgi:hypothetical protein